MPDAEDVRYAAAGPLAYIYQIENFLHRAVARIGKAAVFLQKNKDFLLSQPIGLAHNDAQRSNIIKSNENYYLIDFEFAANNDPIYDIATFGNGDALEGKRLLEEYEKINPVKDGLKRYALWRIDVSLQWYLVATIKHYRGEGKIHGIDFLGVGKHFLNVAIEARKLLK